MKLKKLYDIVKDLVENKGFDLETPVIIVGEYNYGIDTGSIYSVKMSKVDGQDIICESKDVICISCDNYLRETEDLGYSDMWIDDNDLSEFKTFCQESDTEDE
jgi:hypothetical protein